MWLVCFQGCNIADICLVQEVDGQSVCVNETNKAWENGLPKEYYVIAIKDNYYLCCCTKDEFVYSFSSGLGLAHTSYRSLYDYICDVCNISVNIEE